MNVAVASSTTSQLIRSSVVSMGCCCFAISRMACCCCDLCTRVLSVAPTSARPPLEGACVIHSDSRTLVRSQIDGGTSCRL